MALGDDTIIRRMSDATERRGQKVTLRRVAKVSGQLPHPPVLFDAVVDGDFLTGATQISIRAGQAVGRLISGDKLTIGGTVKVTVSGTVNARTPSVDAATVVTPGFTNIPLLPALAANISDGDDVVLVPGTDTDVYVMPTSISARLRPDQIIAGDLFMRLPAFNVSKPATTDIVIMGDDRYSIIGIDPFLHRGMVAGWDLHLRSV